MVEDVLDMCFFVFMRFYCFLILVRFRITVIFGRKVEN